jgi:Integrase core domain
LHKLIRSKSSKNVNRTILKAVLQSCKVCQWYGRPNGTNYGVGEIKKTGKVGERISIDLAGPVWVRKLRYYLICIVDWYSRYCWCQVWGTVPSGKDIFKFAFGEVNWKGGIVIRNVLTVNGTQFSSLKWDRLWEAPGVTCSRTAYKNPQANGLVERKIGEIKKKLRYLYVGKKRVSFKSAVEIAVTAINNSITWSLERTLSELVKEAVNLERNAEEENRTQTDRNREYAERMDRYIDEMTNGAKGCKAKDRAIVIGDRVLLAKKATGRLAKGTLQPLVVGP